MNFSNNSNNYNYYNTNNNTAAMARLKFPPFLQCTRTGNGEWRCQSMVAPGRSYCSRHYQEQKIRNIRKRERKLAKLQGKFNSFGGKGLGKRLKKNIASRVLKIDEIAEDGDGNAIETQTRTGKRKRSGTFRSDDYEYYNGEEGEEDSEVSESEFFMKRIVMRGRGRANDYDGNVDSNNQMICNSKFCKEEKNDGCDDNLKNNLMDMHIRQGSSNLSFSGNFGAQNFRSQ